MCFHIIHEILWSFPIEKLVRTIRILSCRCHYARLIFHLHSNDGILCFVHTADVRHQSGKCLRVRLPCSIAQIGKRRVGHSIKILPANEILPFFHLRPFESGQICFYPFRRIIALGIFPGAEPQKTQLFPSSSRLLNQAVHQ